MHQVCCDQLQLRHSLAAIDSASFVFFSAFVPFIAEPLVLGQTGQAQMIPAVENIACDDAVSSE